MSDLIKREDAIEAMEVRIKWFNGDAIEDRCKRDAFIQALDALSAIPSAELQGELISKDDAREVISNRICDNKWVCEYEINSLPKAEAKQTDCTDFINWLIEVILDDEDWELNAVAYGEIIARKMAKLGLLEVLDGYYIRTPNKPQSVVAEIKIDADEIVKRIKEEYDITDE